MTLVLLGPPGAGKGTQAKRIQARYGLAQISTGDAFRAAVKEGSELGRTVKKYLDSGQLVPDELTSAVVESRIARPDCRGGFMLDGFPRTLGQAAALDVMLGKMDRALDTVLYFDVSDKTAVDRLGGRLTCSACGAGYHVRHMPPAKDGICDKCGGKLMQRNDDKPETIRDRLVVYAKQTSALVQEYDRRKLLRRIDANGEPEEVETVVFALLDKVSRGSKA